MTSKRLKLFKIKGVPVEISLYAILLIGLGLLPTLLSLPMTLSLGLNGLGYLPLALLPLGLFLSILIHEIAHALVGIRFGSTVTAIHLNLLGGATYFATRAPAYFKDLFIFLAGPFSNIGLWGLFNLLASVLIGTSPGLAAVCAQLAALNLFLAIFNALPAYPLYGGQAAYALMMGLTSQQKFAARTIFVTNMLVAAYLLFGPGEVFARDFIGSIFLWMIALWIILSSLALQSHATSIVNFYPSSQEQYAQLQKEAGKWASSRQVDTFFERGKAEYASGRYEVALGSFTQAVELSPAEPLYLEQRAKTYRKLGEWSQALADYNQLLKKPQNRPELYTGRAWVHQALANYPQARVDVEKALELNPLEIEALVLEVELNQVLPQPVPGLTGPVPVRTPAPLGPPHLGLGPGAP
jgi:Zn-dependent protease